MGSAINNPYIGGGAGFTLENTSKPGQQAFTVGDGWRLTVLGPPNLVVQGGWPVSQTQQYNPAVGVTNAQGVFIATGVMSAAGTFQVQFSVAGGDAQPVVNWYTVSPLAQGQAPAVVEPMSMATGSGRSTECPPPILDGFTHSISTLMLPTTYRALAQAQWEVLRRSSNYQWRVWSGPSTQQNPVAAYSQVEYQVTMQKGTYIWGWYVTVTTVEDGDIDLSKLFVQVVDMQCGQPILSDYQVASTLTNLNAGGGRLYNRYPSLFTQPYLVAGDGQVLFEVYNSSGLAVTVQLALFCAQPKLCPDPCSQPAAVCAKF